MSCGPSMASMANSSTSAHHRKLRFATLLGASCEARCAYGCRAPGRASFVRRNHHVIMAATDIIWAKGCRHLDANLAGTMCSYSCHENGPPDRAHKLSWTRNDAFAITMSSSRNGRHSTRAGAASSRSPGRPGTSRARVGVHANSRHR